jgi:hypothetical protein
MLPYGIPTDLVDDHLFMGESQAIKYIKCFAVAIVRLFGEKYLRASNTQNTTNLGGFPI